MHPDVDVAPRVGVPGDRVSGLVDAGHGERCDGVGLDHITVVDLDLHPCNQVESSGVPVGIELTGTVRAEVALPGTVDGDRHRAVGHELAAPHVVLHRVHSERRIGQRPQHRRGAAALGDEGGATVAAGTDVYRVLFSRSGPGLREVGEPCVGGVCDRIAPVAVGLHEDFGALGGGAADRVVFGIDEVDRERDHLSGDEWCPRFIAGRHCGHVWHGVVPEVEDQEGLPRLGGIRANDAGLRELDAVESRIVDLDRERLTKREVDRFDAIVAPYDDDPRVGGVPDRLDLVVVCVPDVGGESHRR